jgi:CheY-like chemotaxis protein
MPQGPLMLYAEDDENDAFFMQRAFAKLNRSDALRIVRDGAEAVEYLVGSGAYSDRGKNPLPSIVVLDVKMPRMSGLEVLSWIRSHSHLARVPVVMLTSSTHDSDIVFSREHGANGYLVKPGNAEHLAALIDDLLGACQKLSNPRAVLPIQGNRVGAPAR